MTPEENAARKSLYFSRHARIHQLFQRNSVVLMPMIVPPPTPATYVSVGNADECRREVKTIQFTLERLIEDRRHWRVMSDGAFIDQGFDH